MEFEQRFSEADFIELEKVFSKTMETESSKILFWRKPWIKISLFFLSGILFLCSGLLYFLEGSFSNSMKLYLIIAIAALCWPFFLDTLKRKKDMMPSKLIRSRYGEPFRLNFKENSLEYRKEEFLYTSVSTVVEYKKFLFVKANKKWLIIKVSEEEKDFILEKMEKHTNTRLVKKEAAFSLNEW